jgi:hypothetical protein
VRHFLSPLSLPAVTLLCALTGVLYDSIGSKLSMKLMFLVFGIGMFVVALIFAGIAVHFKPYVAPPQADTENAVIQCELSREHVSTSLLGSQDGDVNLDRESAAFQSKEISTE